MDTKQKKRPVTRKRATDARTATTRKRQRAVNEARTRQNARPERPARHTPDVVYTPAKPFNRNRLLLRLATVVAVVLALTFSMSIFFKVEQVVVSGTEKYDAWTVKEASGIREGDGLLTFGKAKACGKITTALPYVENVRIGIKLPNTVNIEIKELDVVYGIKDSGGGFWLITSQGKVVEQVDSGKASGYTAIEGITITRPIVGQQAVATEPEPTTVTVTGESEASSEAPIVAPVTVTGAERLSAALTILQYLEDGGVIGKVAGVNVENLSDIELWYGQQYQVLLGDTTQLSYKIQLLCAAVNGSSSLKDYDSGVLDISFTIRDEIIYDAFD